MCESVEKESILDFVKWQVECKANSKNGRYVDIPRDKFKEKVNKKD